MSKLNLTIEVVELFFRTILKVKLKGLTIFLVKLEGLTIILVKLLEYLDNFKNKNIIKITMYLHLVKLSTFS